MALWPNGRNDISGWFPTNFAVPGYDGLLQRVQRNLSYFGNEQIAQSSSVPEGAFQSPACILPPLVGGGMSSGNNETSIVMQSSATLLSAALLAGSADAAFDQSASLGAVVTLVGAGTISFSQAANLQMTVGLEGDAIFAFSTTLALGSIIPLAGNASFVFTAAANLKGLLELEGHITPFTELSPENLAQAVWAAIAADNQSPGSQGEMLLKVLKAAKTAIAVGA